MLATVYHRIVKFYMDMYADADLVCSHTGHDVACYFRSVFIKVRKIANDATSNNFGSDFSGVAFCLAQPMGGLLVRYCTCTCVLMDPQKRLLSISFQCRSYLF